MSILPIARPQWARSRVEEELRKANLSAKLALVGVRGYYRDSMGVKGRNDRGVYDDAIMLISPDVYASFNANTDPSIARPRIATLIPGVWWYRKGKHKWRSPSGYPALIQASPVTVWRDEWVKPDTGMFGINIHRGSLQSTSSLGCQTIHPTQWNSFLSLVYGEMDRAKVDKIPYLLVEAQG